MKTQNEQLFELALRFYERRLDRATHIQQRFAANAKRAPEWTHDTDQMQAEAWDEARRFMKAGEGHE